MSVIDVAAFLHFLCVCVSERVRVNKGVLLSLFLLQHLFLIVLHFVWTVFLTYWNYFFLSSKVRYQSPDVNNVVNK